MPKIYGQLEEASLETRASDPSASTAGRIWRNSTEERVKTDDGTNKRALLRNDAKCVIGNSGTASQNIRAHRGAAGVLQFVTGDDATAEGSLSTTLNQISGRLENYTAAGQPSAGNAGRLTWTTDTSEVRIDNGSTLANLLKLTTKGDILTRSTVDTRLAVGTDGQVLKADSTQATGLIWGSAVANLNVESISTTDSTDATNNIVLLSGASFTLTLHTAVGNTGQVMDISHNGTSLTQLYTLATTGGQTIGGIASGGFVLYTSGERLRVVSNGSNWIILDHHAVTDYANWTPSNTQGFGTISANNLLWRRTGRDMIVRGYFTAGTVTGSEAQLELPSSSVIGSYTTANPEIVGGYYFQNSSTNSLFFVVATAADTFFNFTVVTNAASNATTVLVGSSASSTGSVITLNATVPISGWQP